MTVAMTHNHNNYSSNLSFNANTANDQGSVHNHTGDTAVGGVPNNTTVDGVSRQGISFSSTEIPLSKEAYFIIKY